MKKVHAPIRRKSSSSAFFSDYSNHSYKITLHIDLSQPTKIRQLNDNQKIILQVARQAGQVWIWK